MLLCSFTKKKTGSVFPAFCYATFHHALITCCNVFLVHEPGPKNELAGATGGDKVLYP